MRNLLLLVMVVLTISCTAEKKVPQEKFKLGKGTNLAHFLSQSSRRGVERERFITEEDVEYIASLGFEHVRLPIDEMQMWDEEGNRYPEAWSLMDSCVTWAIRHHLCVIVDLHILRSHHFNHDEKPLWTVAAEQEKFFDLWRDLSSELKKFPTNKVAYELMNEAVADDHEDWNKLLANAHAAIRDLEAERIIVIGSNRWQSVDTFNALKVPENDSNIVLSFHFYEPFLLTHYKASWTGIKDYNGPFHYPGEMITQEEANELSPDQLAIVKDWVGKASNKESMLAHMMPAIDKAKKLGLPLYCGEYGVISSAVGEDMYRWYSDMSEIFVENNISSANWNYKSDNFGLVFTNGTKNQEVIDILTK